MSQFLASIDPQRRAVQPPNPVAPGRAEKTGRRFISAPRPGANRTRNLIRPAAAARPDKLKIAELIEAGRKKAAPPGRGDEIFSGREEIRARVTRRPLV